MAERIFGRQRFTFPRETRAARLKVLLAQPGWNVQLTDDGHVFVRTQDWNDKRDFERRLAVALGQLRITGRLVRHSENTFTIYLEERQS